MHIRFDFVVSTVYFYSACFIVWMYYAKKYEYL